MNIMDPMGLIKNQEGMYKWEVYEIVSNKNKGY